MARSGFGPVLVEAMTYRMAGHTTSDDPTIYRTADQLATWVGRDPIEQFKRWGSAKGLLDDRASATIRTRVDREMDSAVKSWIDRKQ
jgi:pyruvate dehydrogenase E1 component alpha subunit